MSCSLTQFVDKPTRDEKNILDLLFCSDVQSIIDFNVCDSFPDTDHNSVQFRLLFEEDDNSTSQRSVPNYKMGDYSGMCDFLSALNWDEMFENCNHDIEECYDKFKDAMYSALETYVPIHRTCARVRRFTLPRKLRKLRSKKSALFRKRHKLPNGIEMYRECKKEFKRKLDKYIEKKEAKCIASGDNSNFFKFVNRKLKSRKGVGPLMREDGTLTTDDQEQSELLNRFFSSVFTVDDGNKPVLESKLGEGVNINEIVFTPEKVCNVLKKLPNKVSRNPENIPALFLKMICKQARPRNDHNCCCICVPLSKIFNFSMQSGVLPTFWRTAEVVPVFKKGSVSSPSNYRPVSLTSIPCKVMETVIKNEMVIFLSKYNVITPHQHGFLARRSVETQLLECLNEWTKLLQYSSIDVMYLDFCKAFDSVSLEKLKTKMTAYGIVGKLFRWLVSFLSDRTQRVYVNQKFSDFVNVISGVPQGSVLGPLLFLLFINDVVDFVQNSVDVSVKIFADDLKVFSAVPDSLEDDSLLTLAVEKISDWTNTWQLNIAVQKCAVLPLGNKNPARQYIVSVIKKFQLYRVLEIWVLLSVTI